MTRRPLSLLSTLFLCLAFTWASTQAFASHLRGTTVSWSPTSTAGTVQFTIQYSQRTSAGGCSGTCALGGTISVPFSFGDGTAANVTATITSVNAAEDYFSATGTVTHAYPGNGPYTAYYDVCCRVGTIVSGGNEDLRMETLVTPFASPAHHSPVSSMPAIVTVPLQATTGFTVSAADPDGDNLSFRLATSSEMYSLQSFGCAAQQPPGLSISNSGQVTWDTTRIATAGCGFVAPASGDIWAVQFMVQDLDSTNTAKTKVPVDLIVKFVSSTEAPPTITLSNPGPITAMPGTPVVFTVGSDDATANSRVTFNVTGLPVGATSTNTNQALTPPISSTFSWTPTASQTGSYVITYTVTNDTFEQTLASMTINVPSVSPPVTSCPASLNAQYNNAVSIPVTVSDPQGDALTVVWSADGSAIHTDNVAASSSTSSPSLSQTFLTVGPHTVGITATDTDNLSASCSTPITVTAADQSVTFGALPNLTYGSSDVALSATSTSGLPVTFAAAGSCSIVSGAVHPLGAGTCSITATQAGNSTYNAAQQVTQSFQVNQRPLTVTAQNATRQYGAANPTFTGTVTGVVNSDVVTATYTSAATATSPVGTYAIVPTLSGAALASYSPVLNNGTLTVTAGPASKLATSTIISTLVSGGNLGSVTATVEDAYSNTATTSTAVVTATITGPNAYSQTVTGTSVHGVATLNLSSLSLTTAGPYTVTMSSTGLTGTSATLTVTPGEPSKLVLGAVSTSIISGQSLTPITVTAQDSNSNTATSYTGSITATLTGPNGFSQIVTGTPINGAVVLDLSSLSPSAAGSYTLAVTGSGLTPATTTITVAAAAQTISLPALPNVTYGAGGTSLPLTSSAGLPIVYSVTGPAVLQGSSLTITGAGTITVTATQTGDAAHSPVIVSTTFTVAQATSTIALSTSSGVANTGAPVTLTAQVASPAGTPTGTVTFLDGSTVLGTAPVGQGGTATLTLSTLPTGLLSLTAKYGGDTNFVASSSTATLTQVEDFGISATAGTPSVPAVPGETASFTIALTPGTGGFTNAIALTATGLPPGATYSFSPATATPGSTLVNTTLTVQTAKPVSTARALGNAAGITFALLALPFSISRKARNAFKGARLLSVLGALLLLGSIAGLTGCGTSNGFFGQAAQTYTVTVTGTSGSLVHSTQVVLNVQ